MDPTFNNTAASAADAPSYWSDYNHLIEIREKEAAAAQNQNKDFVIEITEADDPIELIDADSADFYHKITTEAFKYAKTASVILERQYRKLIKSGFNKADFELAFSAKYKFQKITSDCFSPDISPSKSKTKQLWLQFKKQIDAKFAEEWQKLNRIPLPVDADKFNVQSLLSPEIKIATKLGWITAARPDPKPITWAPSTWLDDSEFAIQEPALVATETLNFLLCSLDPIGHLILNLALPKLRIQTFTNPLRFGENEWNRYCVWLNRETMTYTARASAEETIDLPLKEALWRSTEGERKAQEAEKKAQEDAAKNAGKISKILNIVTSILFWPEEPQMKSVSQHQPLTPEEQNKVKEDQQNQADLNYFNEQGKKVSLPPRNNFASWNHDGFFHYVRERLITKPSNYWRAVTTFFKGANFHCLPENNLLGSIINTNNLTEDSYREFVNQFKQDIMTDRTHQILAIKNNELIFILIPDSLMQNPTPKDYFKSSYMILPFVTEKANIAELRKKIEYGTFIDTRIAVDSDLSDFGFLIEKVRRWEIFDHDIYTDLRNRINHIKNKEKNVNEALANTPICTFPRHVMNIVVAYADFSSGLSKDIFAVKHQPVGSLYQIRLQKERERIERAQIQLQKERERLERPQASAKALLKTIAS